MSNGNSAKSKPLACRFWFSLFVLENDLVWTKRIYPISSFDQSSRRALCCPCRSANSSDNVIGEIRRNTKLNLLPAPARYDRQQQRYDEAGEQEKGRSARLYVHVPNIAISKNGGVERFRLLPARKGFQVSRSIFNDFPICCRASNSKPYIFFI